jgi:hypothetical protein
VAKRVEALLSGGASARVLGAADSAARPAAAADPVLMPATRGAATFAAAKPPGVLRAIAVRCAKPCVPPPPAEYRAASCRAASSARARRGGRAKPGAAGAAQRCCRRGAARCCRARRCCLAARPRASASRLVHGGSRPVTHQCRCACCPFPGKPCRRRRSRGTDAGPGGSDQSSWRDPPAARSPTTSSGCHPQTVRLPFGGPCHRPQRGIESCGLRLACRRCSLQ